MPKYQIIYGDYTFPKYARMSVSEQILYADDGATHVGTAYTFTVNGYLTSTDTADFRGKLAAMECALRKLRRFFRVRWTDQVNDNNDDQWQNLWSFTDTGVSDGPEGSSGGTPGTVFYDIDWGPKPQSFNVLEIIGGRAAIYSWSLSVVTKTCCGSGLPNDVLAIVRQWDHTVDQNGFTTRRVSGKLTVTARSVDAGKPADAFRHLVLIDLPKWFERIEQNFQQSPNGRELSFTITDRERQWTLPKPITSGRATWTVKISALGALVEYILSGHFEAPANVPKTTILAKIAVLAASRFPLTGSAKITPGSGCQEFSESVYDNSVDFTITATGAVSTATNSGVTVYPALFTFGKKPPSSAASIGTVGTGGPKDTDTGSDGEAAIPGPYGGDGNITSGIMAASLQGPLYDACDSSQNPTNSEQPGGYGGVPSQTGTTNNGPGGDDSVGTPVPPYNGGNTTQDHLDAYYIAAHEEFSFEVDNGMVVFPCKVVGKAPIVQQTRNPLIHVIQAGYATRVASSLADAPIVPEPIVADSEGIVVSASVTPANPIPVGTGDFQQYTVHWCYRMTYTQPTPKSLKGTLRFPTDPRTLSASGGVVEKVPAVIQTPT